MRGREALPICAALVAGCAGEALPSRSLVRALRVIAIATTTPEVRPGSGARVEAVVLDPPPARPAFFRWKLCDEASIDDPRACATSDSATDLGDSPTAVLPRLALRDGRAVAYVVFVAACADAPPVLDRAIGHFRCTSAGSEAFRRVIVRADGPWNHPPRIARWELTDGNERVDLLASGGDVVVPRCAAACAPWTLRVTPDALASEPTSEGPRESLAASFYVTGGYTDRPRDVADPGDLRPLSVRWTAPSEPGAVVELRVVLRDQRGGESVGAARVRTR